MNIKLSAVPDIHRSIANQVATALGVQRPPIARFWDDNHHSFVDILSGYDSPQSGVTSYSTIGLSDHPLILKGKEFDTRVEFVGACGSGFSGFDNVLASVAFCVINSHWFCAPGVIFPDIIATYGISKTMADVYFVPPFLWESRLRTLIIDDRKVSWLLAVPISKAESTFAQQSGAEKLEVLFEERNIDIFDLNRDSVI